MSDIRIAIEQLDEPQKSLGKALMEFYETMKSLEKDEHRGGKQATKIVMTINDIEKLFPSPDNTARTAESDSIWLTELGIGFKERELILKRFAQDSKEVTDEKPFCKICENRSWYADEYGHRHKCDCGIKGDIFS